MILTDVMVIMVELGIIPVILSIFVTDRYRVVGIRVRQGCVCSGRWDRRQGILGRLDREEIPYSRR